MNLRSLKLVSCNIWLLLIFVSLARADDFKNFRPTGYVTDRAGIIQPQAKAQLEALCTELEQKTGAQLAVVTVKSLDGEDVQTYANELFKQLGVGQKKEDTGALLLVAPNDRKYWTEVGYGLEPIITDARAGDAGRLMVPYFRQGDYSSGVTAAAWQLAKYIADDKGVTLTGAPQLRSTPEPSGDFGATAWIVIGVILLIFFLGASSGSRGPRGGGGSGGAFWTGLILGALSNSGRRGGGWGGSRGGWGSGGGSWGGGGGGFGGFGGGSSGGGGAGGSW